MTCKPARFLLALALLAAACDKSGSAPAAPAAAAGQKDGADGLKAVFADLATAYDAKDFKKGKELTMSLMPDGDALKKAFKDGVPADTADKILAPLKGLPQGEEALAKLLVPGEGRTEIKVYGSTTEDLIAYKEGTPAFAEFPGGAKRVAEAVLRPGMTFYEVEVTKPGEDTGMKYHLFFWDGARWRMLGPAWRGLK